MNKYEKFMVVVTYVGLLLLVIIQSVEIVRLRDKMEALERESNPPYALPLPTPKNSLRNDFGPPNIHYAKHNFKDQRVKRSTSCVDWEIESLPPFVVHLQLSGQPKKYIWITCREIYNWETGETRKVSLRIRFPADKFWSQLKGI